MAHRAACHFDFCTLSQHFLAVEKIYPLGIPVLYATILWNRRDLLNPRICPDTNPESDGDAEAATRTTSARENKRPTAKLISSSKGRTKNGLAPQKLQELDEKVKARREHPELVPFMFLWKDFGEGSKQGCTLPQFCNNDSRCYKKRAHIL